jgi:hypothetical protein
METTHETLHLVLSVQWNIFEESTSFAWLTIFFARAFEYGDDAKFWGYVGANAEPHCVELCNFVQCHSFVKYLTCNY